MLCRVRVLAQLALATLAAHGFRLSPSWQPARPTDAADADADADSGRIPNLRLSLSPPTTAGPVQPALLKRDETSVCAYGLGHPDLPLTCHNSRYTCRTSWSAGPAGAFGCCSMEAATCHIYTSCLDYDAYAKGWCSTKGVSTWCCSDISYPYCHAQTLVDIPSLSIILCQSRTTVRALYATPTGGFSASTTKGTASSSTTSSTTFSSSTSTDSNSQIPATTTSIPTATPTAAASESNPISTGAIVGGVVSGIAILAGLVAFIAWLYMRRKRGDSHGAGTPQAHMQEQHHQQQGPPPPPPQQFNNNTSPQQQPAAQYQHNGQHNPGHVSIGSWSQVTPVDQTESSPRSPNGVISVQASGGDRDKEVVGMGLGAVRVHVAPVDVDEQAAQHMQQQGQQPHATGGGGGQTQELPLPHYMPGLYLSELPQPQPAN